MLIWPRTTRSMRRYERPSAWRFPEVGAFAKNSDGISSWGQGDWSNNHSQASPLPLVDLSNWSALTIGPKTFLMENFIPAQELTLITGAGGVNKSTFGQQLATCVAAGLPMLGVPTQQGAALYVTAEDDEAWLRWMQVHICSALRVSVDSVKDTLCLSSLRGHLNNELALFDYDGSIQATPTFEALRTTVSTILHTARGAHHRGL